MSAADQTTHEFSTHVDAQRKQIVVPLATMVEKGPPRGALRADTVLVFVCAFVDGAEGSIDRAGQRPPVSSGVAGNTQKLAGLQGIGSASAVAGDVL
jgi:hypothetical protein